MPLDMHAQPHMKLELFNVHVVPQCWDLNCEVDAKWYGSAGSSCCFRVQWLVQYCDHAVVDQCTSAAYNVHRIL